MSSESYQKYQKFIDTVRNAADGNWLFIVSALSPECSDALKKPGKHVRCPVHGGTDGFRLFKSDFLETGGGICNTCGPRHDGFELLMWLNDWTFNDTLEAVAGYLGVKKEIRQGSQSVSTNQSVPQVTACGHAVVESPSSSAESAGQSRGAGESHQVIPLLREKSLPHLMEIQKKLQIQAEQHRRYSAKLKGKIAQLWDNECLAMNHRLNEPLRAYFHSRQLLFRWDLVERSDCVRFHPNLPYYDEDGKVVGNFPAIVFAIRDKLGALVTLHRIYLTATGKKARVPEPKKMMPIPDGMIVTGASIRLGEPTEGILGVAEGGETALAAFRATNIPVWATVNATLMESFDVPDNVHTVLIWADKDKSLTGEKSANVLKSRIRALGKQAYVLLPKLPIPPKAKGVDWNDVLIQQGIFGFPSGQYLRDFIARRSIHGAV